MNLEVLKYVENCAPTQRQEPTPTHVSDTHTFTPPDRLFMRQKWSEFTALESPGQCVVKSSAQVRYLYRPDLITLAQT